METVASGLALFRSLQEAIHEPADGDVLVLGAYEPAGAQDLEMLSQALDRGLTVIAIAPPGQLTDRAHAHIPHIADQQNGILTTPGIGRPMDAMDTANTNTSTAAQRPSHARQPPSSQVSAAA